VDCELCVPARVVAENAAAYARYDSNSLAPGHVIVVPRRHVADFFEMTAAEQAAVLELQHRRQRGAGRCTRPERRRALRA
jgi:diadenosine tetraphosphate (Ap4A) HIT family hydrolase